MTIIALPPVPVRLFLLLLLLSIEKLSVIFDFER
jgi:hypothetical protein